MKWWKWKINENRSSNNITFLLRRRGGTAHGQCCKYNSYFNNENLKRITTIAQKLHLKKPKQCIIFMHGIFWAKYMPARRPILTSTVASRRRPSRSSFHVFMHFSFFMFGMKRGIVSCGRFSGLSSCTVERGAAVSSNPHSHLLTSSCTIDRFLKYFSIMNGSKTGHYLFNLTISIFEISDNLNLWTSIFVKFTSLY